MSRSILRSQEIARAAIFVTLVAVSLVALFGFGAFRSITDFIVTNRLTGSSCSVSWSQQVPVCSDGIADFVDLPFMRIVAGHTEVSDWADLQLHEVAFEPDRCETVRVRHVIDAYGIPTNPELRTQTVWLSDGNVYTVASHGLVRGDDATPCIGRRHRFVTESLTLQLSSSGGARYARAVMNPMPGERFWWRHP